MQGGNVCGRNFFTKTRTCKTVADHTSDFKYYCFFKLGDRYSYWILINLTSRIAGPTFGGGTSQQYCLHIQNSNWRLLIKKGEIIIIRSQLMLIDHPSELWDSSHSFYSCILKKKICKYFSWFESLLKVIYLSHKNKGKIYTYSPFLLLRTLLIKINYYVIVINKNGNYQTKQ